MPLIDDNSIDLTITSPPYDNLRTYEGGLKYFKFEPIAKELFRITKKGGVVIWIVRDATIKGNQTGTSFKQALYFKDIGFNLIDTMIFETSIYVSTIAKRYDNNFHYMFILSKKYIKAFNPIIVKKSEKSLKRGKTGRKNVFNYWLKNGNRLLGRNQKITKYKKRTNIWYYLNGINNTKDKFAFKHPATFPEKLAEDHIISWSNPGDLILDPMCGSGTTCKMAILADRKYIGIEVIEKYYNIALKRISNLQIPLTNNCRAIL